MSEKDLLLPDIGDFKDVEVIELLVAAGDLVKAEDSLLILESDKATIPSLILIPTQKVIESALLIDLFHLLA